MPFAAAGYEPVLAAFADRAALLGRGGGAFAASVGGRPVVDTWGGEARPGEPWAEGTTTVIMSATKGLASLCLQILVDQGRIDLDARVADYWPEYAQAGKEATTVRQVQLHTCGLLSFPGQRDLLRWDGTGWDQYDAIAAGIAAAPPAWPPGTKHGYHAVTYGWLVGELVRRVTGRTIGRFFRDEVGDPLGLDTWIGTPDSARDRVAEVWPIRSAGLPKFLRRLYDDAVELTRDETTLHGRVFMGGDGTSGIEALMGAIATPGFLAAEFPSGNGTSTARSLARVFAMLANGGELDGHRIVSPEVIARFGEPVGFLPDALAGELKLPWLLRRQQSAPVPRGMGYLGNVMGGPGGLAMPFFGPNPRSFGVQGLGGQVAFADPDNRIAAGFVRSDLALIDVLCGELVAVLYDCARRVGDADPATLMAPPGAVARRVQRAGTAFMRRIERRGLAA